MTNTAFRPPGRQFMAMTYQNIQLGNRYRMATLKRSLARLTCEPLSYMKLKLKGYRDPICLHLAREFTPSCSWSEIVRLYSATPHALDQTSRNLANIANRFQAKSCDVYCATHDSRWFIWNYYDTSGSKKLW